MLPASVKPEMTESWSGVQAPAAAYDVPGATEKDIETLSFLRSGGALRGAKGCRLHIGGGGGRSPAA